jgi:hypothetical protein
VGGSELRVDCLTHLVVEVREVPLVGRLDNPVEGEEHARGDLH